MRSNRPVLFFVSLFFSMLVLTLFFKQNSARSAESGCWIELVRLEKPVQSFLSESLIAFTPKPLEQAVPATLDLLYLITQGRLPVELRQDQKEAFHFEIHLSFSEERLKAEIMSLQLSRQAAEELYKADENRLAGPKPKLLHTGESTPALDALRKQWLHAMVPASFALSLRSGRIDAAHFNAWEIALARRQLLGQSTLPRDIAAEIWEKIENTPEQQRESFILMQLGSGYYEELISGRLGLEEESAKAAVPRISSIQSGPIQSGSGILLIGGGASPGTDLQPQFKKLGELAAALRFSREKTEKAREGHKARHLAALEELHRSVDLSYRETYFQLEHGFSK